MEKHEQAPEQVLDLLNKKMFWIEFDDARLRAMQLKKEKTKAEKKLRKAREVLGRQEKICDQLEAKEKHINARFQSLDKDAKKVDSEMQKQKAINHAVRQAKTALMAKTTDFEDKAQAYDNILAAFKRAKNWMRDCKKWADNEAPLKDADGEKLPLYPQLRELPVYSLDEAENLLEFARARVNSDDVNPDVLRRYKEWRAQLDKAEVVLEQVKANMNYMDVNPDVLRRFKETRAYLAHECAEMKQKLGFIMASLRMPWESEETGGADENTLPTAEEILRTTRASRKRRKTAFEESKV